MPFVKVNVKEQIEEKKKKDPEFKKYGMNIIIKCLKIQ